MDPHNAIQFPIGYACLVKPTRVARVINVDDLFRQDYTALRFERTIHWFRSLECEAVILNSEGLISRRFKAWNDHYGVESALNLAMNDAQCVQAQGVRMPIRVSAVVKEMPFVVVPEHMSGQTHLPSESRKPLYHRVPQDWAFDDERVERWIKALESARNDGTAAMTREENQLLYIEETTVNVVGWRSDWTDEENDEARAGLLALAQTDSKKEAENTECPHCGGLHSEHHTCWG